MDINNTVENYRRFTGDNFIKSYYDLQHKFVTSYKVPNTSVYYSSELMNDMIKLITKMKELYNANVNNVNVIIIGVICGTINFILTGLNNIWNNTFSSDYILISQYFLKLLTKETINIIETNNRNNNFDIYITIGFLIGKYNYVINNGLTMDNYICINDYIKKLSDLQILHPIILNTDNVSINILSKICEKNVCPVIGCFNKHRHSANQQCIFKEEYDNIIRQSKNKIKHSPRGIKSPQKSFNNRKIGEVTILKNLSRKNSLEEGNTPSIETEQIKEGTPFLIKEGPPINYSPNGLSNNNSPRVLIGTPSTHFLKKQNEENNVTKDENIKIDQTNNKLIHITINTSPNNHNGKITPQQTNNIIKPIPDGSWKRTNYEKIFSK